MITIKRISLQNYIILIIAKAYHLYSYVFICVYVRASLVTQMVKNPPTMQEIWVGSLGQEDPLEKGIATHCSILAWRIPWTEKLGWLQSMWSQRVGHNWATNAKTLHTHIYVCIHIYTCMLSCCHVQIFVTLWTDSPWILWTEKPVGLLAMDFSGKNTGVDCHFLLQIMCVYIYIHTHIYVYTNVCIYIYID